MQSRAYIPKLTIPYLNRGLNANLYCAPSVCNVSHPGVWCVMGILGGTLWYAFHKSVWTFAKLSTMARYAVLRRVALHSLLPKVLQCSLVLYAQAQIVYPPPPPPGHPAFMNVYSNSQFVICGRKWAYIITDDLAIWCAGRSGGPKSNFKHLVNSLWHDMHRHLSIISLNYFVYCAKGCVAPLHMLMDH